MFTKLIQYEANFFTICFYYRNWYSGDGLGGGVGSIVVVCVWCGCVGVGQVDRGGTDDDDDNEFPQIIL